MPRSALRSARSLLSLIVASAALLGLTLASGCATAPVIPGTSVTDNATNREIIEVCEQYRHAMEERDADTLIQLASPDYFEDSATPKAEDDYGYEGLKQVLVKRLAALKSLRYNIRYLQVEVQGSGDRKRALVDIRYDASFQLATEMGDRWERKQSDKQFSLEWNGQRWLFLGGM